MEGLGVDGDNIKTNLNEMKYGLGLPATGKFIISLAIIRLSRWALLRGGTIIGYDPEGSGRPSKGSFYKTNLPKSLFLGQTVALSAYRTRPLQVFFHHIIQ
jgi:hypothetical protein